MSGLTRAALLARFAALVGLMLTRPRRLIDSVAWAGEGAASVVYDFGQSPDADTWGNKWLVWHWRRRADVRDGSARFFVPDGLETSAPSQPLPIFLLDCEAQSGTQFLGFSVSRESLRPGLLFGGRPPFSYYAVTVERVGLVLAEYERTDRRVLAVADVTTLERGAAYRLKVANTGGRVRAKLWRGREPSGWQLDVPLAGRLGCFGVVAVHPTDFRASVLRVRRYELKAGTPFSTTKPGVTYALSGYPEPLAGASMLTQVRAGSSVPAAISFEYSVDGRGAELTPEAMAGHGPFTARAALQTPEFQELRWRPILRSLSSGAETQGEWHTVTTRAPDAPIALAAASCAQMWGKPTFKGLTNVRTAAGTPLQALVYQGDLGYANNIFRSAYKARPDFFADRFIRFLADPRFAALRLGVSTLFTLDDHDYGPRNNTWGDLVEPWAIDLWNRMHADSSDLGYFDFRNADVHFLTLENRRYSDPPSCNPEARISRLGNDQFSWMKAILTGSNARLFVIFSAGIFASRSISRDSFLLGWTREYKRTLALFHRVQLLGKRVVIVSGDAHGFRVHHHPDPEHRAAAREKSVVELICSGLQARSWTGAREGDATLDKSRNVLGTSGLGLVTVDPPTSSERRITLRAIAATPPSPGAFDLFPPLVLPFAPLDRGFATPPMPSPRLRVIEAPQE